ncbi:MAG: glucose-1-phosphate adenylyltransferase subunit GlgD [Lachnospiraceae bacterium]|nr:glucose-1-phosphate adenylyltransferase subunit GlgD [Lachnospiraceae bacterium]
MKAIGIILAGGNDDRLGVLTGTRAVAAMPVGSCYRAIDFSLSSMSASHMNKVAVITQYNSRTLHDHLTSSKWWDFGRKQGGLFVFGPYISRENPFWFRGTADSIYQNMTYLKRSNEDYVIIASGDSVYKMDFRDVVDFHEQKGADMTIVYKSFGGKNISKMGVISLAADGKIEDFEEKPLHPKTNNGSLGIYIISRSLLISLLEEVSPNNGYDFVRDVIIRYLDTLKIYGYRFDGYWRSIGAGIDEYFNTNMDFLNKDVRFIFFREYPYIATKPKDEPPIKYNPNATVKNVVCGSGSILNGHVENSVLFRRVYTGDFSVIKRSIIMEGSYIGNNCIVENAIIDKDVVISDGKTVLGSEGSPVIIAKGTII